MGRNFKKTHDIDILNNLKPFFVRKFDNPRIPRYNLNKPYSEFIINFLELENVKEAW